MVRRSEVITSGPQLAIIINKLQCKLTVWKIDLSTEHCFYWELVSDICNLICTSYKLNKCDLLVIHWINAHSANTASKVPAGVHSNRGNNLHVFTGTLCVDWKMLCLSYSVMFACQHRKCCIFLLYYQTWHNKNSLALWRCTAAENFKFPNAQAMLPLHITLVLRRKNSMLWYIYILNMIKL